MDQPVEEDQHQRATADVPGRAEAPTQAAEARYIRAEGKHAQRRRCWSGSRIHKVMTSNWFIGVVLAVLAWPTSTSRLAVINGVGTSWQAALTMASHRHMEFGSHAIFTYGPLGFLVSPEFYFEWTAVLSFIFTLVFMAVLLGALVWSLRRTISLPLAVVVAYLLGSVSLMSAKYFGDNVAVEEVLPLVLMVCVAAVGRPRDDPMELWVWGLLGGMLSLFSLVKISLGVAIAVALVITVACLLGDRRRVVGTIVLGAVPVFGVAWFGTGNGVGNMSSYVRSSVQIIGGYGAAMSTELPGRGYSYWLAGVAVILVGAFAAIPHAGLASTGEDRHRAAHDVDHMVPLQRGIRAPRLPRPRVLRGHSFAASRVHAQVAVASGARDVHAWIGVGGDELSPARCRPKSVGRSKPPATSDRFSGS